MMEALFFAIRSFTAISTDMDTMIHDERHVLCHLLVSNGWAFLRSPGSFYVTSSIDDEAQQNDHFLSHASNLLFARP